MSIQSIANIIASSLPGQTQDSTAKSKEVLAEQIEYAISVVENLIEKIPQAQSDRWIKDDLKSLKGVLEEVDQARNIKDLKVLRLRAFLIYDRLRLELIAASGRPIEAKPEEAKSKTPEDYNKLGDEKYNAHKYEGAIVAYTLAIEQNKNYALAYSNRGWAKYHLWAANYLKKYPDVIKDFDKAIALDPNSAEAYEGRAYTNYRLKKYDEAIKDFNKTKELKPNYADRNFYSARAWAKYELKKYKEALIDFDKAIDLSPHVSLNYYRRAFTKGKLGDKRGAEEDYNKACELDPDTKEFEKPTILEETMELVPLVPPKDFKEFSEVLRKDIRARLTEAHSSNKIERDSKIMALNNLINFAQENKELFKDYFKPEYKAAVIEALLEILKDKNLSSISERKDASEYMYFYRKFYAIIKEILEAKVNSLKQADLSGRKLHVHIAKWINYYKAYPPKSVRRAFAKKTKKAKNRKQIESRYKTLFWAFNKVEYTASCANCRWDIMNALLYFATKLSSKDLLKLIKTGKAYRQYVKMKKEILNETNEKMMKSGYNSKLLYERNKIFKLLGEAVPHLLDFLARKNELDAFKKSLIKIILDKDQRGSLLAALEKNRINKVKNIISQTLSVLKEEQALWTDPRFLCKPAKEGKKGLESKLKGCELFDELRELPPKDRIHKLIQQELQQKNNAFANAYKSAFLSRGESVTVKFYLGFEVSQDGRVVGKPVVKKLKASPPGNPRVQTFINKIINALKTIDFRYADLEEPLFIYYPFIFKPSF